MTDLYTVLKRPLVTEKSSQLAAENKYVFEVDRRANKIEIAKAAETLFKVKVVDVTTAAIRPKAKRLGARTIEIAGGKKAVITLAEGSAIDIYGG